MVDKQVFCVILTVLFETQATIVDSFIKLPPGSLPRGFFSKLLELS